MELRDYLRVIRKGWIFLVVFTLVGIAVAACISIFATPMYEANSKVFVSLQSAGTVQDLTQGSSFTQNQVKSYADIVTTPAVLDSVISTLGLDTTADALAKRVDATTTLDTVVVGIQVTDASPVQAAAIANAISSSFAKTVGDIVPVDKTGVSPVKITVLQNALVPTAPSSPNTKQNLLVGGLVGLILGLAAAALRSVLDTKIRNEHDVEAITSLPILGGIAYDPKATTRPLVVQDDPRSPRAESFRTLRTNLQFLISAGKNRSYVITSSVPGEGKSTTSVNLAIVTASAGMSVVLVDADLRKPKVDSYLGLEGGAGLTDLLIGRAELGDVLQTWGPHNLKIVTAGRIPPNPSELLGSKAMAKLIEQLESEFDLVLFDTAPILPVTDAAILSTLTDGAIVMVAAGRSHKGQLKGSLAALQNVNSTIAGIVMTMMPTKGPDSYGYGRYGYGYGYGLESESPKESKKSKGTPAQAPADLKADVLVSARSNA